MKLGQLDNQGLINMISGLKNQNYLNKNDVILKEIFMKIENLKKNFNEFDKNIIDKLNLI